MKFVNSPEFLESQIIFAYCDTKTKLHICCMCLTRKTGKSRPQFELWSGVRAKINTFTPSIPCKYFVNSPFYSCVLSDLAFE